ncbi:hypothetical protein ACMSFF_08905 [Bacteroides faecis]
MLGKNYSRKLSLYQKDLIPLSVYHLPYRTLRKSTIFYLKRRFLSKVHSLKKKNVKWSGEYIVTLFAAKKIKDLIKGCQLANITDGYFIDKINKLCHKWLQKIQNINIDLCDNRTSQLSDCLFAIHEFMVQNEKGLEFLGYFIPKTENNE